MKNGAGTSFVWLYVPCFSNHPLQLPQLTKQAFISMVHHRMAGLGPTSSDHETHCQRIEIQSALVCTPHWHNCQSPRGGGHHGRNLQTIRWRASRRDHADPGQSQDSRYKVPDDKEIIGKGQNLLIGVRLTIQNMGFLWITLSGIPWLRLKGHLYFRIVVLMGVGVHSYHNYGQRWMWKARRSLKLFQNLDAGLCRWTCSLI